MKTPDLPEEKPSAPSKRDYNSVTILADAIKARVQAGGVVGALDHPAADRPLFWAAITRVRDVLLCVRLTCTSPNWPTDCVMSASAAAIGLEYSEIRRP